jgi:predicted metalloprotease
MEAIVSNLNDWQRVAREFGDHHVGGWNVAFVKSDERHTVGDWLPSEPTAKEILRLRKRVEVLERVAEQLGAAMELQADYAGMTIKKLDAKYGRVISLDDVCETVSAARAALDAAKEAADGN